jgi:hypothetical protein
MNLSENLSKIDFSLKDVLVKTIEYTGSSNSDLKYDDSLEVKVIGDFLIATYGRYVYFEPSDFFCIEVLFNIRWDINETAIDKMKDIEEKELTFEDKMAIVSMVPYEASLIISQLTKSMGLIPLITQPIFVEKDKD